jgi:predicted lipoprotein with Yx(FWY)xxD motif
MRRLTLAAAAVTLLLAQTSLASKPAVHNTIATAHNTTLGQTIVVDKHGLTAYRLSPETAGKLLCKSSSCLAIWNPITVASKAQLHAGHGVNGKLGVIHRAHGALQVTLRGFPLYTYVGDSGNPGDMSPGDVMGEGIQSFNGTWKALSAASGSGIAPPSQSGNPGGMPGYTFPGY